MKKNFVRYEPELLYNYSPWIKPIEPLAIANICEPPTICLEVSCAFIPYLLGLLELARWPDRFTGTTEQQEHSAGLFRDLMQELAMSCGCNGQLTIVIEHRITINGTWEISIDGGETWTPDPESPFNTLPQLPPPVTAGIVVDKCAAASYGVEHAQAWKDEYVAQLTEQTEVKEKIMALLLTLLELCLTAAGVAWLTGAAAALFAGMINYLHMQPAAFNALFTSEVWQDFLCVLQCNMQDDGTFSANGFQNVIDDCETEISGGFGPTSAALWLQNMVKMIQIRGLNQICAYGTISSMDCTDCACDTCGGNWDIWQFGEMLDTGIHPPGTFILGGTVNVSGGLWVEYASGATSNPPPAHAVTIKSPAAGDCCAIYYETLTGEITNFFIINCGDAQDPANWNFSVLQGSNANAVELASSQPFTVRVTFLGA